MNITTRRIVIIVLLFIVFSSCVKYVYFDRTINPESVLEIEEYIEKNSIYKDINVTGVETSGKYCAVTFNVAEASASDDSCYLYVFKGVSVPSDNRYVYFGAASSTKKVDTYNFNQGGKISLIVVYGNVVEEDIAAYSIENCGRRYYTSVDNLSVLDIYIFEDSSNPSSDLIFYDSNGNIVY